MVGPTCRQHGIYGQTTVSSRARPGIVFGSRSHTGAYRIALDITDGSPGVRIVEHTGVRTKLPYMPAPPVFAVELGRIRSVTATQRPRDGMLVLRDADDVDVVGHQTIGRNAQSVTSGIVIEQLSVEHVVGVIQEDIETADASLGNMMRKTRADNPSHSRHDNFCGVRLKSRSSE